MNSGALPTTSTSDAAAKEVATRQQNSALKSKLTDEEETLLSMVGQLVSNTTLRSHTFQTRLKESDASLVNYETHFAFPAYAQLPYCDLYATHGEGLTVDKASLNATAVQQMLESFPSFDLVECVLHDIAQSCDASQARRSQTSRNRQDCAAQEDPIEEWKAVLQQADHVLSGDVSSVLLELHHLLTQDIVRYVLLEQRKFDADVQRCERLIQTEREWYLKYFETNEYKAANQHQVQALRALCDLIELRTERMQIPLDTIQDGGPYIAALARARNESHARIANLIRQKEHALRKIDQDVAYLERLHVHADAQHIDSLHENRQLFQSLTLELEQNSSKITELWNVIENAVQQIHELTNVRTSSVKLYLDRKRDLEDAHYHHEAMTRSIREHIDSLSHLRTLVEKTRDLGKVTEKHCSELLGRLHTGGDASEQHLRDLIRDEVMGCHALYQSTIHEATAMMVRCSQRIDTLQSANREVRFRLEIAPRVFDDQATHYPSQLKANEAEMCQCRAEFQELEKLVVRANEVFAEARGVLIEMGIPFEDPQYAALEENAKVVVEFYEKNRLFWESEANTLMATMNPVEKE